MSAFIGGASIIAILFAMAGLFVKNHQLANRLFSTAAGILLIAAALSLGQ